MSKTRPQVSDRDFTFRTWPFYWLARADGRYVRSMEVALKTIELDVPSWRVLMTLHEEGRASVSELADHAIAKLSTMTRIVKRMQGDGLVTCRPRETDHRVTEVILTLKGEAAGAQAWDIARATYDRAFRTLSGSEVDTLNRLLRRIGENLDERRK